MILNPTIHDDATDAERALLGRLMLDHEPHEVMPGDLGHQVHADMLGVIEGLAANGRTPDPVTVAAAMPDSDAYRSVGGRKYLAQICTSAEVTFAPIRDLAATVLAYGNKRRLSAIAADLTRGSLERETEAADLVATAQAALEDIRHGAAITHRSAHSLSREIEQDMYDPPQFYPTGLPTLDQVLEGGLYPGKVYAFDGRMKSGKTVMLGTIARSVGKGDPERGIPPRPTVYLALEMGAKQIQQRLLAADLGINASQFIRRTMHDLPDMLGRYNANPPVNMLTFEDKPNLSFDRLRHAISQHCRYHGAKVIVLDYWQLVTGQGKGQTEAFHLGAVAQWLAGAAKEYGVAIVTACQRNREGESRGGDGLKAACDVYMRIHKVEVMSYGHAHEHVWLEMTESRYTAIRDVGSADSQILKISNIGPVIEEYGQ